VAGTNAVAVKKELFRRLALEPGLAGVQVAYRFPGNLADECVYGGKITGTAAPASMRPAAGRQPRQEDPAIAVHVRVLRKGDTDAEADERALVLLNVVGDMVAADPMLSGAVPGLLDLHVDQIDIESAPADDETTESLATLQLVALSHLT